MGMITDRKSPRLAGVIGMSALGLGYFPIRSGTSLAERPLRRADIIKHMRMGSAL